MPFKPTKKVAPAPPDPFRRPQPPQGGSGFQIAPSSAPDAEGHAILACLSALQGLENDQRSRVLRYVGERYGLKMAEIKSEPETAAGASA